MGSEFPKISKKLIKQLNRIKTDSSVIRDAKSKLEIFAVIDHSIPFYGILCSIKGNGGVSLLRP